MNECLIMASENHRHVKYLVYVQIGNQCVREPLKKYIKYQTKFMQGEVSIAFGCRNNSMDTFQNQRTLKEVPLESFYQMYKPNNSGKIQSRLTLIASYHTALRLSLKIHGDWILKPPTNNTYIYQEPCLLHGILTS